MDLHSALLVPAIFACIAAIVVGAVLRLIARFARRVGDIPHCGGCDYSLTGIASDRCPECGRELSPTNIAKGAKPPRRRVRGAGLVLVLGGFVALVPITYYRLNLVDWYFYRAPYTVIDDAASMNQATADRAWSELDRRRALGQLSAEAEQKLIAVALDEHAKPRGPTCGPNWQKMVDLLCERYDQKELTTSQVSRFLEPIYRIELKVRPIVAMAMRRHFGWTPRPPAASSATQPATEPSPESYREGFPFDAGSEGTPEDPDGTARRREGSGSSRVRSDTGVTSGR